MELEQETINLRWLFLGVLEIFSVKRSIVGIRSARTSLYLCMGKKGKLFTRVSDIEPNFDLTLLSNSTVVNITFITRLKKHNLLFCMTFPVFVTALFLFFCIDFRATKNPEKRTGTCKKVTVQREWL